MDGSAGTTGSARHKISQWIHPACHHHSARVVAKSSSNNFAEHFESARNPHLG